MSGIKGYIKVYHEWYKGVYLGGTDSAVYLHLYRKVMKVPRRGRDQDGRRLWYIWNALDPRIPNLQRFPRNSTGTQSYEGSH